MAVGDEAKPIVQSYVALSKETTFGTYASATTAVETLSLSFKETIVSEKLDAISTNRGFSKRVQLDKEVAGSLEQHFHPEQSVLLLAAGLGGGISSNSLTSAADHTLTSGNFDTDAASLSFNVRKGPDASGIFRYTGGRINNLKIAGNVSELIVMSADFMFKDATNQSDDVSSILSVTSVSPFTYVNGVYRYADTAANAATTTAEEAIMGFELNINNNLKSDADARELGSRVVSQLPATRREVTFKITQRYDTTTSFDRYRQATQGAVELKFTGETITAEYNYEATISLPKVFLNTNDPELSGPGDILKSDIEFDVLVDNPNTSTGKDVVITVRNGTSAY